MTDEEKQIIEDYFQDCEYIIGQDEIDGLLDKINQLLKTRQEKMIDKLKKEKKLHLETYEDNILEKGIIIGIDKALEIINLN